jgi:hypothetical protein
MERKPRKKYSREFKLEAVRLADALPEYLSVRRRHNSCLSEITHSQAEHISATNADEKLEPYVGLDHQHGPGISFGL